MKIGNNENKDNEESNEKVEIQITLNEKMPGIIGEIIIELNEENESSDYENLIEKNNINIKDFEQSTRNLLNFVKQLRRKNKKIQIKFELEFSYYEKYKRGCSIFDFFI
ncbi:hypothetical protein DMUE_1041 [Dictyocoela muelleri]|nr:hypothetical protein DMUE_1041 [Dictyocoela muelleri]